MVAFINPIFKSGSTEPLLITNRSGQSERLDISQIRKVVEWAIDGLDVNPIELEANLRTRLNQHITTREIQDNLIDVATSLTSQECPDWRYVAGRLLMWSIHKETSLLRKGKSFSDFAIEKCSQGVYSHLLSVYTKAELEEAQTWLNHEWDKDYDLAGVVLLQKRYVREDEFPQETWLVNSLILASVQKPEDRLNYARQFYEAIAQRKLSLATPMMANLRFEKGSVTSCFITSINDDLESIFSEVTNVARISKNGGGAGVNLSHVRALGSTVMGNKNASGGVVPWIKLLNNTATAVNQGGRRAGAVTVSLDIWHLDMPEFLELQTENGDQRRKAYDIYPQVVICDEFMRRVTENQNWTLFDPQEIRTLFNVEIAELWGDEFDQFYRKLEKVCGSQIKLYRVVKAKELFIHIMRSQVETGMPYLSFKDTINRANPNQHQGYIPATNLCVAPETKILTDKGQFPIIDLVDRWVQVWNGSEWSKVKIKKTGENQPLLKVELSNGESLECTYYHHFWVKPTYDDQPIKVEAKDLNVGDKLIKYELPLISNDSDIDFPYAYTSGCFSGDGGYSAKNHPELDLYGEKKKLIDFIAIRNKLWGSKTQTKVLDEMAIYHDVKQDRIVCKLPLDLPKKYTVPLNGYTIQSRLDWLAGLLDTDGTVSRNGDNESVSISSIHKQFLLEIRLMLQTLGVDSKVTLMHKEVMRLLPDGQGGSKEYLCKTSYRLLINSNGLFELGKLGLKTNRLKWKIKKPQRKADQFIQVTNVEFTGRVSDTYCFTEPKRNLGMFNGVLTGQCVESFSNVKSGEEAHCCNLLSLNLANIESDELEHLCSLSVRILDNSIEITTPPFKEAKVHNNKYRTIGVGAMGLADWLAKQDKNFYRISDIDSLFEDIAYFTTKASYELALERGAYPSFEGSEWSKGNLLGAKPPEFFAECSKDPGRWNRLRASIMKHGIRNSHITAIAPNTSSSLVQGCTASVLPPYKRFFIDKWAKGALPIAVPFIKDKFWFYQENVTLNQKLVIDVTATIQKWIDTGISMELVFNLNEGIYGDEPINAKDIYDLEIRAWKSGVKAIYYVRTIQKDNFRSSNECSSCAN